ncbi:MAG: dihydrofolate reductase [Candidatus Saccharibacteria bacterium]|nr:dihydrofolate reductase [Candidatus Saccharibacteria bacterium]
MKTIVVAFDKNYGIGANNDLLWLRDLPADLKHFKDLTTGHTIVMGRNTFNSIGRALPNRQNIVVSHSMEDTEGVEVAHTVEEAYELATSDIFIIGGAQIYTETLKDADVIEATEVQSTFENATVFFPTIDSTVWEEVSRDSREKDERNKYAFDFVRYIRR